jgi:predicted DNA-binding transcriptional regulator AlpA
MMQLPINVEPLVEEITRRVLERLQAAPADAMVARALIAQQLGVSVSTVKRLQARPGFPKPRRLPGVRGPRWSAAELEQWKRENL